MARQHVRIEEFLALGRLPSARSEQFAKSIEVIRWPLKAGEAELLASAFTDDADLGLAWALV